MRRIVLTALALCCATPAFAQEGEIIVTAQRISSPGQMPQIPGIGIKRQADFAVQPVTVKGDTRDKAMRRKEILATVRSLIEMAGKRGVQVSYGATVIQPLTLANYAEKLRFQDDSDRNDAEEVSFVVKSALTDGNAIAAGERLDAFLKAVPLNGRAEIDHDDEAGVSIVNPNQYRGAVIAAIAADANASAKAFGPDYAVDVSDLARPVHWVLTGPTEVLLYMDYSLRIAHKD